MEAPVVLILLLISVQQVVSAAGPVFINPTASSVVTPATLIQQTAYTTQTVYGFLDFTTTIGNTVMVFSPQSAAPPVVTPPKELEPEAPPNAIETKPSTLVDNKPLIQPSKTKPIIEEKTSEKKMFSVVQVQAAPPSTITPKAYTNTPASSKVSIVQGVSSLVQVKEPISSKISILPSVISKVAIVSQETPTTTSKTEISASKVVAPVIISSITEVREDEPAVIVGNNINEPEYEFLSRQPSEVVEETYKVINIKPSSKFHLKPRTALDAKHKATKRADTLHPTGLVTKLGGTVVKDGVTTVHETSVIGTYISGKYAQVLQSSSHLVNSPQKGKINPSSTLRILKTAAPTSGKGKKHHRLEPTPVGPTNEATVHGNDNLNSQINGKSVRKGSGVPFKPKFKNRQQKETEESLGGATTEQEVSSQSSYKKSSYRNRNASPNSKNSKQNTTTHRPSKFGRSRKRTNNRNRTTTPPPSPHREEEETRSFNPGKRFNRKGKQGRQTSTPSQSETSNGFSRRGYKPKVQATAVDQAASGTTSLYKFKLNRSPGRWQYKTTPKPRVTIRKQLEEAAEKGDVVGNGAGANATPATTVIQEVSSSSNEVPSQVKSDNDAEGLEGSESIATAIDDEDITDNKLDTPAFPLETIKVEISTPPDFKDVYYEIATIKSPYTFQVGSVKNTRYITVTSTFEKSLTPTAEPSISPTASEPLTENILATSSSYDKDNYLDSSIATLPPIYLASDMETPPLETLTETFSTTQTMLKTHVLPIISGNDTVSSTLIQTYMITRLVTATKTLPPMEAYHFNPSRTLNEFNSHLDEAGSELHLELDFGDNDQDIENSVKKFPADLDLANIGSDFDLTDMDKSRLEGHLRLKKAHAPPSPRNLVSENHPASPTPPPQSLSPEQLQQLALLRLLNPAAVGQGQAQVVTTSRPVVRVELVYESHTIPIVNGHNTIFTTVSRVAGTVTRTEYEVGTSTIAPALATVPQVPVQPLFPQLQPQFAVTSSPIVQSTQVTQTQSKVLKLTFGAKTAYTTVYSTQVVPTLVTTYVTAQVPVQPTAAYPGYFPAPFPAYPFVG